MKVYISADIEGLPGILDWDECRKGEGDYTPFADMMTEMVRHACDAALEAGAKEIWIKDAHATGRNIDHSKLPEQTRLIRGWSGHPFAMVQEIDDTFDGLMMLGYHSAAASDGNPLSHTMKSSILAEIKLNGMPCSEFLLHSLLAKEHSVPTCLVLGDEALGEHVNRHSPGTHFVCSGKGVGDSTIGFHPQAVWRDMKERIPEALNSKPVPEMMGPYELNLTYRKHQMAYEKSFYPGAERTSDISVGFKAANMAEIMRAMSFLL